MKSWILNRLSHPAASPLLNYIFNLIYKVSTVSPYVFQIVMVLVYHILAVKVSRTLVSEIGNYLRRSI